MGVAEVLLEEYRAIKAEQNECIKTRDTFIYSTMIVIGAVTVTAITTGLADLMLGVPGGVLVLGWLYLANDRKIAWAREYLRSDLRPRLASHLEVDQGELIRWETPQRYWGLGLWRFGGLLHDLAMFVLPPAAVLVWWALTEWDGTLTNPIAWGASVAAADTLLVAVAVIASTAAQQPIYGRRAVR